VKQKPSNFAPKGAAGLGWAACVVALLSMGWEMWQRNPSLERSTGKPAQRQLLLLTVVQAIHNVDLK